MMMGLFTRRSFAYHFNPKWHLSALASNSVRYVNAPQIIDFYALFVFVWDENTAKNRFVKNLY
jgi:hypothetical protein